MRRSHLACDPHDQVSCGLSAAHFSRFRRPLFCSASLNLFRLITCSKGKYWRFSQEAYR